MKHVNLAVIAAAILLVAVIAGGASGPAFNVDAEASKSAFRAAEEPGANHVSEALMSTDERRRLTIEGHDDSAVGSNAYNSRRRAASVRSYLILCGYPAELIETPCIGQTRPIAADSSPAGRSNNRRQEIIVQREAGPQKYQSNDGGQE